MNLWLEVGCGEVPKVKRTQQQLLGIRSRRPELHTTRNVIFTVIKWQYSLWIWTRSDNIVSWHCAVSSFFCHCDFLCSTRQHSNYVVSLHVYFMISNCKQGCKIVYFEVTYKISLLDLREDIHECHNNSFWSRMTL